MSLFKQLEKLNIPLEELSNLTEKEIIRIEKKLKANVILIKDIDINEVNQITATLRNSKSYLNILLGETMVRFREITENPSRLIYFSIKEAPEKEQSDDLKSFIQTNFSSEIREYVRLCIKSKHYRALNSLLYYRNIFDDSILDEIQDLLLKKIDFAIECIKINANNLDNKIDYLYNPYFFRCFNFFEKTNQEEVIIDLINCVIPKLKNNRTFYRILYAMGIYSAISANLKKTLKNNKSVAISQDVFEQQNFKKHPKGGTISTRDNYKNSRSKHLTLTFSLTAGLFVFIFIVAGIYNSSSSSNESKNNSKYKRIVQTTYFNLSAFIERAGKTQLSKDMQYFEKKDAIFHEDSLGLESIDYNYTYRKLTTIINNINKHVVLAVEHDNGYKLICIEPLSDKQTESMIDNYVVYRGNDPVTFKYINQKGIIQNGFKFNEFEKSDYYYLNKQNSSSIKMIPFYSYEFNIFCISVISHNL